MVISGCVGPRGDGYDPARVMSEDEAQRYHAEQVDVFTTTAADMVTAITMTNIPEAIGVTRAAQAAGMPVVISFTVETDGRLPTGDSLQGCHRARGRGHRCGTGVLHDQLRPPDPLRWCAVQP